MAGPTRNRMRDTEFKAPTSNQSDRDATVDNTPSASSGAPTSYAVSSGVVNAHAAYASSEHSGNAHMRDEVSRLSEDLQPMHIGNDTPLHQQLHEAAGEADPLGRHMKDAISSLYRLQGLGLQRLKISLPKIVVLGEQSTGKSSVIEAISGIKTPRSTDTCTRCPLFINLESSDDPRCTWSATVTLRLEFTYDGKTGRGAEQKFPGWARLAPMSTMEFASTDNPKDLEYIIGRAQMAIISPMVDYKEFLKPSITHLDEYHRAEFSPNVVCISIRQFGLPALSFYDLPGIIGQAESASAVKFVRDLVTEYVKDAEALVLVTCSLENDIANSTASGIAREVKATDRCIGVLTKPDRIPEGSRDEKLRAIFENKRFILGHGYFVVRNLGQDQIDDGLTHRDARVQEQLFFANNSPWATTLAEYQSRFGTLNLQTYLSGKLAEHIITKVPIIHDEINARLRDVENELQQHPEPPTLNATRIISDLVLEFSDNVRKEIEAEYPCKGWRNNWHALRKTLFDALVSLKPTMGTWGAQDKGLYDQSRRSGPGGSANDAFVVESDGEHEAAGDGDVQMSDNPETPTKKRKIEATPGPSPFKNSLNRAGLPGPTDYSKMRKKFQLDEVAQYLHTVNSKVPGQIEPRVVYDMMIRTLDNWPKPLQEFFDTLEQQLSTQVKVVYHKHFGKWEGSALYSSGWKIIMDMLNSHLSLQRTTMADDSLIDEKDGPYIFHEDIFGRDKDVMLQYYRQARLRARFKIYKDERELRTDRPMTTSEQDKARRDEKIMAVLKEEPYSVELDVVSQITTYYMMATRRFHDSICMRIESKFFKQLRTQLRGELESGLEIHDEVNGHRKAVYLLAEQNEREQRRRELVAIRASLLQGQKVLHELQQKKYGDDDTSSAGIANEFGSFGMPTPLHEEMDKA